MTINPDHVARCRREGTVDAIFLFQFRRVYSIDPSILSTRYTLVDGSGLREDDKPLSMNQMAASGIVRVVWETVGVWLSREEAEEFGRHNKHNYGIMDDGLELSFSRVWRVQAVPAMGELASMLRYSNVSNC